MFSSSPITLLRRVLLPGLLSAVVLTVPSTSQETDSSYPKRARIPATGASDARLDALFTAPSILELDLQASKPPYLGPPPARIERTEDGHAIVTLEWDSGSGLAMERRSATFVISGVPEPTPLFLGACAGCVFLLYRRRISPSRPQSARANSSDPAAADKRRASLRARRGVLEADAKLAPVERRPLRALPDRPALYPRLAPLRARFSQV